MTMTNKINNYVMSENNIFEYLTKVNEEKNMTLLEATRNLIENYHHLDDIELVASLEFGVELNELEGYNDIKKYNKYCKKLEKLEEEANQLAKKKKEEEEEEALTNICNSSMKMYPLKIDKEGYEKYQRKKELEKLDDIIYEQSISLKRKMEALNKYFGHLEVEKMEYKFFYYLEHICKKHTIKDFKNGNKGTIYGGDYVRPKRKSEFFYIWFIIQFNAKNAYQWDILAKKMFINVSEYCYLKPPTKKFKNQLQEEFNFWGQYF